MRMIIFITLACIINLMMMIRMVAIRASMQRMQAVQTMRYSALSGQYTNETIFALATGIPSAIAVVRIAGPKAYRVLQLVKGKKTGS